MLGITSALSRPGRFDPSKRTLTVCCAVLVVLLCFQAMWNVGGGRVGEVIDMEVEVESLLHPNNTIPEHTQQEEEAETPDEYMLELIRLNGMIQKTNGYFVRDWSLGLGWNNMRYILEASLTQSLILNRTLVIPSFVYARSCEFAPEVCGAYTLMVEKDHALGLDEWKDVPWLERVGYRLPIEMMLDLPHLQATHPVITISQFLAIEDIPNTEASSGAWDRWGYLHPSQTLDDTLYVIRNSEYDPRHIIRVDRLPPPKEEGEGGRRWSAERERKAQRWFEGDRWVRPLKQVLEMREKEVREGRGGEEPELEGVQPLYTFTGPGDMEFGKSVVYPEVDIALKSALRGFWDEYSPITHRIILLEGETHLDRKPGQLWFSTPSARDDFAYSVLYTIQPPAALRSLALEIAERMNQRCEGRLWRSAHMRRGDFLKVGWAQGNTIEEHFERVVRNLRKGEEVLRELKAWDGREERFEVPEAGFDKDVFRLGSPEEGDPIYISTDEKNPEDILWLQSNGAVILSDLLTADDRRDVGWSLLFTDVLGVLEQLVMGHSDIFYGHVMSSLAGGVVNYRARQGKQPRLTLLD